MILYGSTISPFVRKVAAYAAEKGIELEIRPSGLPGSQDPAFLAASPFRKMPALVDGDYSLADSSAIIHYLEAKFPEPELIPSDPRERGKAIWFDEWSDTLFTACGAKMFYNRIVAPRFLGREGDLAMADTAEREELPPLLDYLESVIPDSGYLVGDRFTIADISVASPFANLTYMCVAVDPARHPKVNAYTRAILSRPSFAPMIEREAAMLAPQPA